MARAANMCTTRSLMRPRRFRCRPLRSDQLTISHRRMLHSAFYFAQYGHAGRFHSTGEHIMANYHVESRHCGQAGIGWYVLHRWAITPGDAEFFCVRKDDGTVFAILKAREDADRCAD